MEYHIKKKTKKAVSFSDQNHLDCDKNNGGMTTLKINHKLTFLNNN